MSQERVQLVRSIYEAFRASQGEMEWDSREVAAVGVSDITLSAAGLAE